MKSIILNNALFRNSYFSKLLRFSRLMTTKVAVNVKQGTVLGEEKNLRNGQSFFYFRGIPYAKPPTGKLRFQPPQPIDKFDIEPLDCTKERNIAYHKDPFTTELVGSEDCLFLNIYTPKLKTDQLLPVMVWIHGGAFLMGSGNSDYFYPLHLMEENVIIVTLNYRLGMFGFLNLPNAGVEGNAGLKDQLLAIKWVNENIKNFNGDPNNITLFGQSAGAASIHLHVQSSNSKKYFHKAIMQSGTSNMEWVIQTNPEYKARRLAQLMGCKSHDDKEILEFLIKTNEPFEIYKNLLHVLTPDERRRGLPMPFKPVIENSSNSEAIIVQPPVESAKTPNSVDIPIIFGYNSSEGLTMIFNAMKKLKEIDNDLARLIPRSVNIHPEDSNCAEIAKAMRQFYFNGEEIDKKKLPALNDLMSDYHFGIGIHTAAELHSLYQPNSPLYFYRFSYDGGLNMYKKIFQLDKFKGACHGDELFYLFQSADNDESFENASGDEKIVKRLCKLWANFAKYGNPTPADGKDSVGFQWTPVVKIDHNKKFCLDYLEIDDNTRMEQDPDKSRLDFWRGIFNTWNKGFLKPKL